METEPVKRLLPAASPVVSSGPLLDPSVAAGVCGGFLHPVSLSPLSHGALNTLRGHWALTGLIPKRPLPAAAATVGCGGCSKRKKMGPTGCTAVRLSEKTSTPTHRHLSCCSGSSPRLSTEMAARGEARGKDEKLLRPPKAQAPPFSGCRAARFSKEAETTQRGHAAGLSLGAPSGNGQRGLQQTEEGQETETQLTDQPAALQREEGVNGLSLSDTADARLLTGGDGQEEAFTVLPLCPCKLRMLLSATCSCREELPELAVVVANKRGRDAVSRIAAALGHSLSEGEEWGDSCSCCAVDRGEGHLGPNSSAEAETDDTPDDKLEAAEQQAVQRREAAAGALEVGMASGPLLPPTQADRRLLLPSPRCCEERRCPGSFRLLLHHDSSQESRIALCLNGQTLTDKSNRA